MDSYFFTDVEKNGTNAQFIDSLQAYSEASRELIYVLNRPLTDQRYEYDYKNALIILSPKTKIAVVDFGNKDDKFEDFIDDVVEDISAISDKYLYKSVIGRPRMWRNNLIEQDINPTQISDIPIFFKKLSLQDPLDIKKMDLLISLFIGSINDIDKVKDDVPQTILDKVKQKIQLFDGDQTRFIYKNPEKKRVTIQGLSGTGKTELLLHKLKDIYINETSARIYFTCHSKVLANSLRKRIPTFFNFMKVEQQIEWDSRLWCTNAWGINANRHSGAYKYICSHYNIPFYSYSYQMNFSKACKMAIDDIKTKFPDGIPVHAFDYMFIDESQDFDENFFSLCELVTKKNVYIAGDIFQSIFDDNFSNKIAPDFLLGKCYRTDPKTLMFAHGLGMGLFETNKLRWLEDREWKECGYNVARESSILTLSREPLRRFEDLNDNFESIKIVEVETVSYKDIVKTISEIKNEHPTVAPEDIGIILLDQEKYIYTLAELLESRIFDEIGWNTNKAYDTKTRLKNSIFLTNRNNVKGLEFPFVICVTKSLKRSSNYRNSLYTMLTRSFIKSYLVLPNNTISGLTVGMKKGLKEIVQTQKMTIEEPSVDEKLKIRTQFEYINQKRSHYDIMMEIFNELDIDERHHDKIFQMTQQMEMVDEDAKSLTDFVKANIRFIK